MSESAFSRSHRTTIVATVLLLASVAAGQTYVHANAQIAGKELYAFASEGKNVTIILGEFSLAIGDSSVRGRDAVIWIKTDSINGSERHTITVYVEGDVELVRPEETRSGYAMLQTFRSDGRIMAEGLLTNRKLEDFPLYERAMTARSEASRPTPPPAPVEPVEVTPAIRPQPAKVAELTPATQAAEDVAPPAGEQEPPPVPTKPVEFRADQVTMQTLDDGRRVAIAQGNVYLSQGDPDSDLFHELRAQAAVVFFEQDSNADKDSYSRASIKPGRLKATGETITGVYLEGDVVIARGERSFRGEAAYYDFKTDRAVIDDPVLRTIQESRQVPIYIRAREARMLSAREIWFSDAKVTTSDFHSPEFHLGATSTYLMDQTPYDDQGEALGEQAWYARMKNVTFNIGGVPVFYAPIVQGDLEQGNSPLRTARIGKVGVLGFGATTEWHLFRLLGLLEPEGFKSELELGLYERGGIFSIASQYDRNRFTGYNLLTYVYDKEAKDHFGTDREDIPSPNNRGRVLLRHKQFFQKDWMVQLELSYFCDRNFLEQYYPDEFYTGKEQETVLYAKKQTDNWAFTSEIKYRLNRFQTQAESWPDFGLYVLGKPIAYGHVSYFHESHAGIKKIKYDNEDTMAFDRFFDGMGDSDDLRKSTRHFVRLDLRDEFTWPLHFGPLNVVPYAVGRLTYWGASPVDSFDTTPAMGNGVNEEQCRSYSQVGVRSSTHIWADFDNVQSRLWDLNGIRHMITPEVVGWVANSSGVYPNELFPMDAKTEGTGFNRGIERTSGVAVNLYQRLITKRGPADAQRKIDWMRLGLSLGIYDNNHDDQKSLGRFNFYRPEYSVDRNHLNADYTWNISDSTVLTSNMNYDIDDKQFAQGNLGLVVRRDPRLRYFGGVRYLDDTDDTITTFGLNYKISTKYALSIFEQYNFGDSGRNLKTVVEVTRKFPRWYGAFTFGCDRSTGEITIMVNFWPEGIPEARVNTGRFSVLPGSNLN